MLMHKSIELQSPANRLKEKSNSLQLLKNRLENAQKSIMDETQNRFLMLCTRLEGVNPLAVLSHGYSVVENREGSIVSSIDDVEMGEIITVKLSDGEINATVTEKKISR